MGFNSGLKGLMYNLVTIYTRLLPVYMLIVPKLLHSQWLNIIIFGCTNRHNFFFIFYHSKPQIFGRKADVLTSDIKLNALIIDR
jgi:hypothetical protein